MRLRFVTVLLLALCGVISTAAAETPPSVSLPILCYHRILPHAQSEYDLSLADFHAQIDYLHERGFVTISLQEWTQVLTEKTVLPPRPVILTFDDGSRSAYEAVFPLLKAHGYKGTFFVSPGLLSNRPCRYLNWSHLREMAGKGMEIMPHGYSHSHLAKRFPGEGEEAYRLRVRVEMARSKSLLESFLHRPCPFLAYPYGAYNQEVEEMAKEAGYTLILTACPGTNTPQTDRYRLKRQLIYRDDKIEGLSRKLFALPLSARFPFEEGAALEGAPSKIEIDLPSPEPAWGSPILLLDRKPVDSSYDSTAPRITFVPGIPLRPGLHILEVRIIEEGAGRWHQDSTLFAIRSPRSTFGSRD